MSISSSALLLVNQNLPALTEATRAGKLTRQDTRASPGSRLESSATLQQAVYGVHERNRLQGHGGEVISVAFSPVRTASPQEFGKTLASASRDNTVILWNLDLDNLLSQACNWLHDYLTTNPNVSQDDRRLCDGISNKG